MLIRRLHKGRNCWVWDVRIYDENGKKRLYPTGHTSKKLAKEYEARIKNEIAERKMFPERYFPKIKFKDFIPEYLKKHASKKRSYRDYESITKKLVEFFGEYYLHEISRYQVETYYSLRSEKAGVCMVNREITILKGIFTKAIEWGFLRVNSVKGLKLEKEKPRLGTLCVFNNIPPKTLQKWMGHKSIETTIKYYVVSPEDFEQDVIKRLDAWTDKSADTQTDTSIKKGLQDDPQALDIPGEPWRDRTSDPLIKREKQAIFARA